MSLGCLKQAHFVYIFTECRVSARKNAAFYTNEVEQ